jgi:xylan 1,4-beta-xylosidase
MKPAAIALFAAPAAALTWPDCRNGPLANNTVCDESAAPSARAAALVKAMNITDKLNNLVE